jgi:hypothetical protein
MTVKMSFSRECLNLEFPKTAVGDRHDDVWSTSQLSRHATAQSNTSNLLSYSGHSICFILFKMNDGG